MINSPDAEMYRGFFLPENTPFLLKRFIRNTRAYQSNSTHTNSNKVQIMNVLLRKEAAAQLRISLNALSLLVKAGAIKQIHLTKQRRGIFQADIDAYLAAQRTAGGE